MPSDNEVRAAIGRLSPVGKLVHLALRQTADDEAAISRRLFKMRRDAYEKRLTELAAEAGCGGQRGVLGPGARMTEIHTQCAADAASIVRTFNRDLAFAIMRIRQEAPTANRHVYSKRLQSWETRREAWKSGQIVLHTTGTARQMAEEDFWRYNADIAGYATLEPKILVAGSCDKCRLYVNKKRVSLETAQKEKFPAHPNCPHGWVYHLKKIRPVMCRYLWLGGRG